MVSSVGNNKYIVDGTLTIKDVSRNLALVYIYNGQKENPLKPGETFSGFISSLRIDQLEYHVGDGKFYNMNVMGKDVDIRIALKMTR